jgi:hypothetical protein
MQLLLSDDGWQVDCHLLIQIFGIVYGTAKLYGIEWISFVNALVCMYQLRIQRPDPIMVGFEVPAEGATYSEQHLQLNVSVSILSATQVQRNCWQVVLQVDMHLLLYLHRNPT